MQGVTVTPLLEVSHPLGNIFRALRSSEESFNGFGEAYFTTIRNGATKGWKKHNEMVLNLIVPVGEVKFVVCRPVDNFSQPEYYTISLSKNNYQRLTVQPGLWVAFYGVGKDTNLILNVASVENSPSESVNLPLETFQYDWSSDIKKTKLND